MNNPVLTNENYAGMIDSCQPIDPGDVWKQVPENLQFAPLLSSNRYTVIFPNGVPMPGAYRGFCLNGIPDGRGEWIGDNGLYDYAGDWQKGVIQGRGQYTTVSSVSWGYFCNGYHCGLVLMIKFNPRIPADIEAGIWERGRMQSGVTIMKDGEIWIGHSSNYDWGLHGYGLRRLADGELYVGDWKNAKMSGWGEQYKASGDTYFGEFRSGRYHGWGMHTCATTGATFVGQWRRGVLIEYKPDYSLGSFYR
jgi:hypothetical protein